jgi:RNA polymerase sigma factor (sigma-70 family)
MEASTIHTPAALCPPRITIGPRLLKLRSDEQLLALFREGHDEAFQVLHARYHKRLESYARQMLPGAHDAEDVLQDVFVRAYRALRADDRQLAVKPWLFRVTHNRCIDQLRRACPPRPEVLAAAQEDVRDPVVQADTRESLRRLIEDIRRLPEQQRSALLLRELSGISYEEVAAVLDTTVPAVKSLLVRARMGLLRASDARDTACSEIREQMVLAHDQGVRAGSTVRHHLRDCAGCRSYRRELTLVRRRMAVLLPAGPLVSLAKLLGLPAGSATGTSGAGPAAAVGGGTASGVAVGGGHVAALLAAAVASAGGAVGLQHAIASVAHAPARTAATHRHHHRVATSAPAVTLDRSTPSHRAPAGVYVPRVGQSSRTGDAPSGWVPDRTARLHRGRHGSAWGTNRHAGSGSGAGGSGRSTGAGVSSGSTTGGSTGTSTGSSGVPAVGAWPGYGTGSGTPSAGSGGGSSSTGTSGTVDPGGTTTGDTSGTGGGSGDSGSGSTTSAGSGQGTTSAGSDGSSSGSSSSGSAPPPATTTTS